MNRRTLQRRIERYKKRKIDQNRRNRFCLCTADYLIYLPLTVLSNECHHDTITPTTTPTTTPITTPTIDGPEQRLQSGGAVVPYGELPAHDLAEGLGKRRHRELLAELRLQHPQQVRGEATLLGARRQE